MLIKYDIRKDMNPPDFDTDGIMEDNGIMEEDGIMEDYDVVEDHEVAKKDIVRNTFDMNENNEVAQAMMKLGDLQSDLA